VSRLQEADAAAARLAAATALPDLLDAAWQALDLVRTTAGECADPRSGLYAALLFAAAAAAEAQHAAGLAPSMPAGDAAIPARAGTGAGAGAAAGQLAGLAAAVARRLASAAAQAELPGDRDALTAAAAGAGQACQLLAEGRP
jgi:hypothetical protein